MELPYIEKTNVGGNQFVIRDGAARKMLSDQYDPTEEYVKGDIIIYESVLYECISDTTVTGLWDLSKWSEITIVEMYNKLNRNLIAANAAINELNGKMQYGLKAVPNHTGTYGAYSDVICGYAKIGTTILLFFKGRVRGTADISYSAFGIGYSCPGSLRNLTVARVVGNGGTAQLTFLTDKEGSMQINATAEDVFCATFALLM